MLKASQITNTLKGLSLSLCNAIYPAKPQREPKTKPYLYIDIIDGVRSRSDRGVLLRQALVNMVVVWEHERDIENIREELINTIASEWCNTIYDRDGTTVHNIEEGTMSTFGYTGTLPTQLKTFIFSYQ